MTTRCIPVEEIATVLSLARDDERRRHAESCARCSALMLAHAEFVRASVVEGADPVDARRRLDALIASRVEGASSPGARPVIPMRHSHWARLRPVWAIVAAAVVVTGVVLVRDWPQRPGNEAVRGGAHAVIETSPAEVSSDGSVAVHWEPVPGADAYEVTLLAADLSEVRRLGLTTQPFAVVAADVLSESGRAVAVYWQVTAVKAGDPVATSAPAPIHPR